jgi:hypothetical protein
MGLERAGPVAEDEPHPALARLAHADHQDLVDLLTGCEVAHGHEPEP